MSQVSSADEKNSGLSADFVRLTQPVERQRQIMWLVFCGGILALAAAAQIIAPPAESFTVKNPSSTINLSIFHFAGIGLGVFSLLIRTYTYSDRRLVAMLQSRRMRVPDAITHPFEQGLWRLFRAIQAVQLAGWALNETIAMLGLVAVMVGNPASAAYPFVFAGLILQALSFPRFAPMAARCEKLWQEYQLSSA